MVQWSAIRGRRQAGNCGNMPWRIPFSPVDLSNAPGNLRNRRLETVLGGVSGMASFITIDELLQ